MTKKSSNLRLLANLARQRMLNKDYQLSDSQISIERKVSSYFIKNAQALKKLSATCEYKKITVREDEAFVSRVVAILKEEDIVSNPLGILADSKYLESLSESEKQLYMLTLSDKYNRIKDLYDNNLLSMQKIG